MLARHEVHFPNPSIVLHPKFEIGVTKIQRDAETELTNSVRRAVASVLKSRDSNSGEVLTPDKNSEKKVMQERLSKNRRIITESKYIDTTFVKGSTAEVERLFSIDKNFMTNNRKRIAPQLFEAIVFLKMNERLWNQTTVSNAVRQVTSERVEERMRAHLAQEC